VFEDLGAGGSTAVENPGVSQSSRDLDSLFAALAIKFDLTANNGVASH